MSLLDTMTIEHDLVVKTGRKKEHDSTIIRRATKDEIRYHAPTGRQVLLVWDKACVDYELWCKLKYESGTYFLTMEKANSAAEIMSNDLCDHTDPRNEGIQSEFIVGAGGQSMRRITYTNPMDSKTYVYLTNEMTIPAYLMVSFYKHRWDIEKVYYQFKSKFNERKAWAKSLSAKKAHATFECLLHNLLLMFEDHIQTREKIYDEQEKRLNQGRNSKPPKGFINQIVTRASHRTQRFIRWLRNHLINQASWGTALERLKILWST